MKFGVTEEMSTEKLVLGTKSALVVPISMGMQSSSEPNVTVKERERDRETETETEEGESHTWWRPYTTTAVAKLCKKVTIVILLYKTKITPAKEALLS